MRSPLTVVEGIETLQQRKALDLRTEVEGLISCGGSAVTARHGKAVGSQQ